MGAALSLPELGKPTEPDLSLNTPTASESSSSRGESSSERHSDSGPSNIISSKPWSSDRPYLPLTQARITCERAARRALRKQNEAYESNENILTGITREIDYERQQFLHPKRERQLLKRDEIYAINAMMRTRECRKFEEYVRDTQMSEVQATAMRLAVPRLEPSLEEEGVAASEVASEDDEGSWWLHGNSLPARWVAALIAAVNGPVTTSAPPPTAEEVVTLAAEVVTLAAEHEGQH